MSSYMQKTKHPITGKTELATWVDDYFGAHRYGVILEDGSVWRVTDDGLLRAEKAPATRDSTHE